MSVSGGRNRSENADDEEENMVLGAGPGHAERQYGARMKRHHMNVLERVLE
jgi:hypothetical protein